MDKINIADILDKHRTQKGDESEEILAAIKEIVELVIDKCAEDTIANDPDVDPAPILQVKKMIDYE